MVKKSLIFIFIFLTSLAVKASDLPMLPIMTQPKQSAPPKNYPTNNYNNYYFNNQGSCYNTKGNYFYNCLYSTTLTTKELKARRDAYKKAKLEAKCKENKAKKSKCEKLKED